ncbi:MAG TPA: carboxypeptidase regulatory-like domain-containing protein [Gemmatimonadaceae bacterium]|nr:carboxypeptidase regulatory-like domain-containing protein [Gemmatimonadaceae bacterium]
MMHSVTTLAVAAILATPAFLSAQTSAQSSATITGVAVDSVRGGYLRGAIVSVSGTTVSGMTDSAGRFRIDSVPAGVRYLEVMHPLLDSLSLVVRSPQREITVGSRTTFILSVPSAKTIVGAKCGPADLARGPAALVGTVLDADTEAPARTATVSVEWTDYQLTNKKVNRLPQRRLGAVRPDGTYRVCGIPADLVTGVVAYRGADSTSAVPVNFANGLGVVGFHLPGVVAAAPTNAVTTAPGASATAAQPGSSRGKAVLSGRVVDPGARPLAGARVALEADNAAAMTDNDGKFSLSGLRSGTRSLSVRRLGFEALEVPVDLSSVVPRDVTVTMSRFVPVLDAVRISAVRELGLSRVGFTERKLAGNGKFYGPDDIAARNPQKLNSLLETAPYLRMGTDADGHRYVTGRLNGCVKYYVDGHAWFTRRDNDWQMSPDNFLSGAELAGVEIYDELSAPAEYQNFSSAGANCSVVVIWTKAKLGF